MRIACIILGLLFACFAYWQLNDMTQYKTDQILTYLWVLGYAVTSIVSFITAKKPLPRAFYLAVMLITFTLAAIRFPAIEWVGNVLYNENNPAANETGGLLTLLTWYSVLYFKAHKITPKSKDDSC